MEQIRAVLFDWDGTLLDSFGAGFRAFSAVFERFGVTVDRERFLSAYSPDWYATYRIVGIPEAAWETADKVWLETYHRHPPLLFPFARRTLETLRARGYALGLVTSGDRDRVTGELRAHKLQDFFATLVCSEDTREKKPHPAPLLSALEQLARRPAEAAYVGDRPEDITMGKRAGAYTVAVESAYVTREALEAALPDILLPDAGHLPDRLLVRNS